MHFDLKKPCDNCPFLRKGGIRLQRERVLEIANGMLDSQGITFPCHKTTVDSENEDGDLVATAKSKHCAGALIFSEKQGSHTQMMRIMERLRQYDAKALMSDKETVALVFDDVDEMIEVNALDEAPPKRTG
jgi:hypothetical protein